MSKIYWGRRVVFGPQCIDVTDYSDRGESTPEVVLSVVLLSNLRSRLTFGDPPSVAKRVLPCVRNKGDTNNFFAH